MSQKCITIAGKADGFGAQYQACLSGFAAARKHSLHYIHTPFLSMGHGLDPRKLDQFTGLRSDEWWKTGNTAQLLCLPFVKEVHYSSRPSEYYTVSVLKEIKEMYYSSPLAEGALRYDIAVHIRRGDVSSHHHPERFTPNHYYVDLLKGTTCGAKHMSIAIVSQGSVDDFPEFSDFQNLTFYLDEDVEKSFHILCSSSILVMSKSSSSYCAALISDGRILYQDFWHKPLDDWTVVSCAG